MSTQKLLSDQENGRKKYVNFGVILYPENPDHVNMLDYLEKHDWLFDVVYILHDKDDKKPHWHVMIHAKSQYTVSSFVKFFKVWIDYAEPITSCQSYVAYMLHDTPDSMSKHLYSVSDLHGNEKLIRKFTQNGNFVQLGEVLQHISENHGSMLRLLSDVVASDRKDLLETVKEYQSLICTASNQEYRRMLEKERIKNDNIRY